MGLVLNNRGAVFQEFTHHFNVSSLSRFLFNHPFYTYSRKIKKADGVGAVLVSPQSHNYYHWLFDVLPRIRLYSTVLDQVQHFCISADVPQKFIDILPEFGIPVNKILLVDENEKLHFNTLFVASLPGSEGRSPRWGVDFVREKLLKTPPSPNPTRKIYFKRGSVEKRKILNEDNIIHLLTTYGFDILDPGRLSIAEQISLMQDTRIVVALHGAAMSNLLFASDKCSVIEIFSPDYFRTDCYYTLASLLKMDYHYIAGSKPAHAGWGDVVISEEELMGILNRIV
jgi:capsular polysaccharide biosynthesis protein